MDTETTERAANFSFTKCQIPVGEEIEYAYNPSLKAKVVGDRAAEFNGVTMFLIAFTKQLSGKKYPVIGPRYFKYKGEWLNSIRGRLGVEKKVCFFQRSSIFSCFFEKGDVMYFFFPRWKTPEYTKKEINNAGVTIRDPNATKAERKDALAVIDNWRAAHAYPLHVFYMNLRGKAGSRSDILVAERLKRLDSIVGKLQRETGMELYRMQDLGGCRMVLPMLEEVYSYSDKLKKSRIRHELKKTNDYIQSPKPSGYRSLHLVYRFKTDTQEKEIFNQYPMLIELQFRTHLQHIWATAVETIGLFTNQALKAGQGDDAIKRFFVLVSSLFAIKEGCPVVPGTIADETELVSEIEQINDSYHVLDMLRAIRVVIGHDGDSIPDKRGYYLLQLNYETHMLSRWFYAPSQIEEANTMYDLLERKREDKPLDIVLIRASSFSTVKKAYPNYFLDIGEFVDQITEYLK